MGHPVNPLKVIFLVIITEKFKKNIELMKDLILHNDTVSLTIYISYTLPILTLFQSYTLQIESYTLPIFHSSNLSLFQSYTPPIIHSFNLTLFILTLFRSNIFSVLHSSNLVHSFNLTLFQSFSLSMLYSSNFQSYTLQSCTLPILHLEASQSCCRIYSGQYLHSQ